MRSPARHRGRGPAFMPARCRHRPCCARRHRSRKPPVWRRRPACNRCPQQRPVQQQQPRPGRSRWLQLTAKANLFADAQRPTAMPSGRRPSRWRTPARPSLFNAVTGAFRTRPRGGPSAPPPQAPQTSAAGARDGGLPAAASARFLSHSLSGRMKQTGTGNSGVPAPAAVPLSSPVPRRRGRSNRLRRTIVAPGRYSTARQLRITHRATICPDPRQSASRPSIPCCAPPKPLSCWPGSAAPLSTGMLRDVLAVPPERPGIRRDGR